MEAQAQLQPLLCKAQDLCLIAASLQTHSVSSKNHSHFAVPAVLLSTISAFICAEGDGGGKLPAVEGIVTSFVLFQTLKNQVCYETLHTDPYCRVALAHYS